MNLTPDQIKFWTEILIWAYSLTAITTCISFIPQVWVLLTNENTNGAADISLLSWGAWTLESVISCGYAWVIVQKQEMIFVTSVVVIWVILTSMIACFRRIQYKLRVRNDPSSIQIPIDRRHYL